MTAAAITPADTDGDNNAFKPEDACLRRELGLRPIHDSEHAEVDKAGHPDQRRCPSWCWVGRHAQFGHEIDYTTPMKATHSMEPHPSVVASLYQGQPASGRDDDRFVQTATLEPRLEQLGQADPVVRIAFRRYVGREQIFDDDDLRLTVEDAAELVTALTYVIGTARRG